MKKTIITLFALAQSAIIYAQDHIQFQKLTFEQAKEKALQENKLIFLDGYTSWCAPCKWMEGNVFNQASVANYFNTNFINTKFDCEVGEGITIAKEYQIRSFPTYLFLDHTGALIYRTQSRMEADAFLTEGKQANNPKFHIPTLKPAFEAGNRESEFLLKYIQVMTNADSKSAEEAKKVLAEVATDEFLLSPAGWQTILMMSRSSEDRYGKFFQENKAYYKEIADPVDFEKKDVQLLRYAMYTYIRTKDKVAFDAGLTYFKNSDDSAKQIDAAMYEVDWVGTNGTAKEFVQLTNALRKGVLKDEDEKLSFIARRNASIKVEGADPAKLKQCYILAKQAADLNEMSYSNQGTLADICISLKKKKEAVKAAEAARALAELETSKIIKIADALVARAKAI
ncbi:hypothetical protein KO02_10935 [Sphingobacterium sp. ML3W]|uniref:thioredoxin family protein n=1 Tax=Sphingobacterium sp. ML3W TaxID=1538644 RepID=UPI0004F70F06|nr:thioredoxin family protein [Sphingobacterium sp. ML3W]AIM37146.1 hypothetical protein KO02_10935 [Sphingobacterium sp. ML3W]